MSANTQFEQTLAAQLWVTMHMNLSKLDTHRLVRCFVRALQGVMGPHTGVCDMRKELQLRGLGTFYRQLKKPRGYRHPTTKEMGKTRGSMVLAFRPGKSVRMRTP